MKILIEILSSNLKKTVQSEGTKQHYFATKQNSKRSKGGHMVFNYGRCTLFNFFNTGRQNGSK